MGISDNPSSWPSGDAIWAICQAVALAEGANIAGSRPDRDNNPGDLTIGDEWGQPVAGHDLIYIVFASKQAGWSALYSKFANIAAGGSALYSPSDSWYGIGSTFSPGSGDTWAENVAAVLGVDPTSSMAAYLGAGPTQASTALPYAPVAASGNWLDAIWPPSSPMGYAAWAVGGMGVFLWLFD